MAAEVLGSSGGGLCHGCASNMLADEGDENM